ncbi:transglycosylase domain-containing protein [Blattabacterium cuenoti]|uniref:transglycosylase domain-containing protein n=1 Tax=Blattabacterium cuenoti TaxID=1653831 RepID=UPI001EEC963D|nr:transglycosylase domain-containing protein [Blattabacterium cuenoti]
MFIFYFWFLFFIGIILFFAIFYAASKGYLGALPSTEDIENPAMEVGSEVYDSNGILLGKFFSENRTLVTYNQLPSTLVNALIAKEDIRFKYHSGIDARSILRAIFSLGKKGGGSTISQQLAKLLFTGPSAKNKLQRIHQKLLEWVMAIELEKRYTKEEIITMYYNKFDFLYNAKGIETAAHTYFNKKTSELNLGESAILVGMLENPSLYNPKNYPKKAKKQRNLVLFQMKKYNFLSTSRYKKELEKPIKINFKIQKKDFELLTYYGEFLKKEIQESLDQHENQTGQKLNLYSSGLKIYTSIDVRMQNYAEKSVRNHLKKLQVLFNFFQKKNKNFPFLNLSEKKTKRILISAMRRTLLYQDLKQKGLSEDLIMDKFQKPQLVKVFTWNGPKKVLMSPLDFIRYQKSIIQAGLLSIESSTGFIKAWVGGIDFNYFQYDHVAQTQRQVGSIFKPILYAAAIKKLHYTPCTRISNEKFHLGKWTPRNSNGKYGGFITLKDGLAFSVNTISARLMSQITPGPVIDLAKEMGIKSIIPKHPSIALGSADLTLYEMLGAFNTFNNYGIYVKPSILVKIEDDNGNLIKENMDLSRRQVFNEDIAYIMLKLMQGVIKYGTAKRLNQYNFVGEIAGKTGTTNENSDGWFIGMVPNLTTGIWVGWEDRYSHFESIKLGQGANMALPIWAYYMKSLYGDTNFNYNNQLFFHKPRNYQYNWDKCEGISHSQEENVISNESNKDLENKKNENPIKEKEIIDFNENLNKENNKNKDYDK